MTDDPITTIREHLERLTAERDAAVSALRDLLACVSKKAQMPHEVQLVVWRAEAIVEEMTR